MLMWVSVDVDVDFLLMLMWISVNVNWSFVNFDWWLLVMEESLSILITKSLVMTFTNNFFLKNTKKLFYDYIIIAM